MLGICYQVLTPLYGLISTAVFAPTVTRTDAVPIIGTPETVLQAAKIIKPALLVCVPTFFHTWSQSDEAIAFLRTLRYTVSLAEFP